mmetsp:Transcript_115639/g.338246  ORF Transcript_115639/g.338246 Transcript_115639/m.338246 type:complete len:318 (+) Transcript_115639:243-1196(+)
MNAKATLNDIQPVGCHNALLGAEEQRQELERELHDERRLRDFPHPPYVAQPRAVNHVHKLDGQLRIHPRHNLLQEGRAPNHAQLAEVGLQSKPQVGAEAILPAHLQHRVHLLLVVVLVHVRVLDDAHDLADDCCPNEGAEDHHAYDEEVLRDRCGDNIAIANASERVEGKIGGRAIRRKDVARDGIGRIVNPLLHLVVLHLCQPALPILVIAKSSPEAAHPVHTNQHDGRRIQDGALEIREVNVVLMVLDDMPEPQHPHEPQELQKMQKVDPLLAVETRHCKELTEWEHAEEIKQEEASEVGTNNPAVIEDPIVTRR